MRIPLAEKLANLRRPSVEPTPRKGFTKAQRQAVYDLQRGQCAECEGRLDGSGVGRMNPDTAKIIDRLVTSRDTLRKLDIGDYALIREAREAMADAANALTVYAKTAVLIDQADRRVVEVLTWLDERGRNSQSFGSHADAYEIAARKLRAALSNTEEAGG